VLVGLSLTGALVVRGFRAARLEGSAKEARRRAVLTSVGTVLASLGYVFVAQWPSSTEVRTATLPALAAAIGVILSGAAELTWPRPRGDRRQASITARRGTEAGTLKTLFVVGLVTCGALLVIGLLTAGSTGRAVQRDWPTGAASAGPYPGAPYAVPMALALAALSLATWWALRRVDARPALDADLEDVDRAIRRSARMRVLRLAAAGSLLTGVGLSVVMGLSLIRVATTVQLNAGVEAPAPPFDWTQNAGFILLAVALAGVLATLYALLAPSPSVPAPERGRTLLASEMAG
jgi:hypothetical protein